MGVLLTESQYEGLALDRSSSSVVRTKFHEALLKANTTQEDFLEAEFVKSLTDQTDHRGACTWDRLQGFIDEDRVEHIQDLKTDKEVNNFVSPIAQKLQQNIEKWHNHSPIDFGIDFAVDEASVPDQDEDYGDVDRAVVRKRLIEKIDEILGSRKFPDRYISKLEKEVTSTVNQLHEERTAELPKSQKQNESCFDFPVDEVGCDERPEKRLKNVLG